MDMTKREEIFSKECLSIEDIEYLFDVDYGQAARIIREVKNGLEKPRVTIQGKIHVQDYLDYFRLPADRYVFPRTKRIRAGGKETGG